MFHFGFSYIGVIFLLMLFVPNIIWAKNQPSGYEHYAKNENKIFGILERIGEVSVSCLLLIFSDFNIRSSYWAVFLIAAFLLMVLYEIYWVRYFKSSRTMLDFYSSILGIPVPGASLPVIAVFLIGIYGSNIFLIIASIILGIGHIGIHMGHLNEARQEAGVTAKKRGIGAKVVRVVIAIILSLIFVVISVVIAARNFIYISHVSKATKGIVEAEYITLGGQEQYILTRGNDLDNPVIIYLHGGPSSPDAYETYVFTDYLVDDYTIIAWDQRGCGRTYFSNIDADSTGSTVNFDRAVQDLDELVDYAMDKYNKDEVIIMGWSYGTILGTKYITEHPEKVSAYISIGQFVNMSQNEQIGYDVALERANELGDDTSQLVQAYENYQAVGTLPTMLQLRSYTYPYLVANQTHIADQMTPAILSPYFGMDDFKWFMIQQSDINNYISLNSELFDYLSVDVHEFGTEYQVPVYYIVGSEDYTCNAGMVMDFSTEITAPIVTSGLMDGCGHGCHYDNPEEFARIVKEFV